MEPTDPMSGTPPHGRAARPGATLAVLASAQFAVALSTSIVNVALPAVRDGVGLSDAGMSWVVNSYGLAFGALLLLGGRAADLLGRRRVLLAGLLLFAVAAVAAGLASTPWMLVTARTAQGVGAAAIAPAALSLVMRLHPPGPARGRALGVWGAVSGAGGAAGVLLGGVLTESLGWPWVFHASGIGAALVLAATLRLVPGGPEEPAKTPARLDVAGAITVTTGLVALVYGLTAAGRSGWTDPTVLGAFAAAVVLLTLFLLVERRNPDALLPPGLLSQGAVGPANLVMALLGSVWVGLFFFLPLYQQQVLGAGPLEAGLSQLPLAAANMLGSALAPVLTRRIGPHRTLVAGLVTQAAGLLWLSRVSADGTFLTDVLGPILLIGLGLGVAFVQLTGAAVSGVRSADAGLASGLVNTTRQIGGAVGLAVLGTLAAARTAGSAGLPHTAALTEGYRTAFLASAAVLAAAAVLTRLLLRGARPEPDAAPATSVPATSVPHSPPYSPPYSPPPSSPSSPPSPPSSPPSSPDVPTQTR
ncbi:MFS transporter [Streptomyces sp. NBC_01565]|uniref:MFS transporter n=1 Tax=unclassified Streptomyces TaxID=2593676 RepID=UPI00225BA7E7|nr:MFS transporter [Streptomyces sp. NBC_01565]MCX4539456.1 MFS transporter [Streptomyces sp. NBC_01565]